MKKTSLKSKFRQFTARRVPDNQRVHIGVHGSSVAGIVVGVPLTFVDGGFTFVSSMLTFFGTGISAAAHGDAGAFYHSDAYKGHFDFNGEKYYLGKNQYVALSKLQKKIEASKKKFEKAKTDKEALKYKNKIQKLIDHQKDILMTANVRTTPEVRTVTTLDSDYNLPKKPQPKPN